ncbi:DUF1496 domain-containing protein (plasmid) [Pseudoalteromonas espejiana]
MRLLIEVIFSWYDNKRYSEGALQVHSFILACAASNPQHNNSELIWLKLDKKAKLFIPPNLKLSQ